ncbi:DUF6053 domain-containing protein [Lysobacter capsici]
MGSKSIGAEAPPTKNLGAAH